MQLTIHNNKTRDMLLKTSLILLNGTVVLLFKMLKNSSISRVCFAVLVERHV